MALNVGFKNVDIKPYNIVEEELERFKSDSQEKQKFKLRDTNIPNEARRTGRTLKVNVISDIFITLSAFEQQDGSGEPVQVRTETLVQQMVAQIPLMVGSKYCILEGKTKQELIQLQEDPSDLGGYFIIKGNEWSVDATESVKFNELQIGKVPKKNIVKGFIMSKPGDAFELSIQITIFYCERTGRIYINMEHERFKFLDIPFFFIFKIFGIANEIDMMKMIVQDELNSKDQVSVQLQKYIQRAVDNQYDMFPNAAQQKTEHEILNTITDLLNSEGIRRKQQDLYIVNYTSIRVKETFMSYFLPHMGTNSLDSHIKMRYFGHLLRKLLLTHRSGIYPDQNAYLDKRIHSTGHNIAKAFRKYYNHQVIKPIRTKMIKEIQKHRNLKIDIKQIITSTLNQNYANKTLQKSIITGIGTEIKKTKGQPLKNRIQSQKMVRKNLVCTTSTMRLINNQKQSQDKQSKKILEQRSIQQAFSGYICLVQSTETSEKAGKVKSLGSMTLITTAISSGETVEALREIIPDYFEELDVYDSEQTFKYNLVKIFVNGFWAGFIRKSNLNIAVQQLRQFRRNNPQKWGKVTIYVNDEPELHIYSDYGRLLMPMIIVHRDQQGNPYLKLDENNIKKIINKEVDIDWLLEQQIIEYVSIEEAHNCLVAESLGQYIEKTDIFKQKQLKDMHIKEAFSYLQNPVYNKQENIIQQYEYTHIFIQHALFGLVGLISPFANHTQTQRITMFTNQAKQACGWGTFNFPHRIDNSLIVQYYTSQPSVRTVMNGFFPPNGQQMLVAYTCYDGSNQEDSIIINKGSLDRGLFECSYYTTEETQIKFNEYIEPITGIQPPDQYGNYLKLVDGKIQPGIWIQKNDVLVAKKEQNRIGEPHNTSLVYRKNEPAYVEEVLQFYDESQTQKIVIKLKCIRRLKQGDKLASRQGCKSIVSKILDCADMPFTEDGIVPDMIFNPHSIPTRMIVGQLYDAATSRLCIQKAETFDGTVFCNFDIDYIYDQMEQSGVYNQGYVNLRNGSTGDLLASQVFLCPTFYQRLQKFAVQGQYIVYEGPIDTITRQPIEGRQTEGGIRFGEMEKDCIFSHGSLSIFNEKLYDDSDGCYIIYCRNCGQKARYNKNPNNPIYACDICQQSVDLVKVPSAWITNVFQHSVNAMNIDIKAEFELPVLEIPLE